MEIKYIVEQDKISLRDFLIQKNFSRTFRKKVRLKDIVFINGVVARNHHLLNRGDQVTIIINETLNAAFIINENELDILYEDDYFLIINKQANLASHPSRKHQVDNIISMIASYYQKNNIKANVHIATRLDYLTTGIMIVAKSGLIHQMMEKTKTTKIYTCKIKGQLNPSSGLIDLPIKRLNPYDIRRWVDKDGLRALTKYHTIASDEAFSIVEAELLTGRTHQIRIHMAYLGHPIVGENLYDFQTGQLHLHCSKVSFIHPINNSLIEIKSKPNWQ